jgi:hypothetical protein
MGCRYSNRDSRQGIYEEGVDTIVVQFEKRTESPEQLLTLSWWSGPAHPLQPERSMNVGEIVLCFTNTISVG